MDRSTWTFATRLLRKRSEWTTLPLAELTPAMPSQIVPGLTVRNETVLVEGLTNREFLDRYARPGCIGLSTGPTVIDKAIARAQRHLDGHGRWGWWSHAFLFQGQRADGYHWVVESDLQLHRKHIHLGVQENRVTKYFNEATYTSLAVLDFGLTDEQRSAVVREALDLVAAKVRYSIRELLGVVLALRHSELRAKENILSRDRCFFCSAFVHHLFRRAGIDLLPGVDVKHTAPEDLARSTLPHTKYVLKRTVPSSRLRRLARRVRRRIRVRLKTGAEEASRKRSRPPA